ncbi:hypothetical protein S83_029288 [Arachis hypogaea]
MGLFRKYIIQDQIKKNGSGLRLLMIILQKPISRIRLHKMIPQQSQQCNQKMDERALISIDPVNWMVQTKILPFFVQKCKILMFCPTIKVIVTQVSLDFLFKLFFCVLVKGGVAIIHSSICQLSGANPNPLC